MAVDWRSVLIRKIYNFTKYPSMICLMPQIVNLFYGLFYKCQIYMLEPWFNKFLECLFSSTLVILITEMAGDENQYRF